MTWAEVLAIVNVVMLIGIPVGGYIAIKSSMAAAGQAIQDRVQNALDRENKLLQEQKKRLEAEDRHKQRTLDTIKTLAPLKRRSLHIEITGRAVILVDERTGNTFEVEIKQEEDKEEQV